MPGIDWADPRRFPRPCRHCEDPAVAEPDGDPLCSVHLVALVVAEAEAALNGRLPPSTAEAAA